MVVMQTDLSGVKFHARGKVRDIYDLGNSLLIVTTDRLSAFDVVLPTPIPNKGKVLTQMSRFWFDHFKDVVRNHFITMNIDEYPEVLEEHREQLEGRSMLVRRADVFPVECVVRGYLTGSGWKDYKRSGAVCGIQLPAGLTESVKLDEPIFTPSTKAVEGHDENISLDQAADMIGRDEITTLRDLSIDIYKRAASYALERGIIICDTKFEFGMIDGAVTIVDEMLTPDSSRFWPADQYESGRSQPSFDKQFVRDYLESVDWDKQPPGPELPIDVVEGTSAKYAEAFNCLTGLELA